jgi:hypothetical protein
VSVVCFNALGASAVEVTDADTTVVDGERSAFGLEMFWLPPAGTWAICRHIGGLFLIGDTEVGLPADLLH